MGKLRLSLLLTTLGILLSLLFPASTSALSGSEFQAGRIMDDTVFFNGTALSVQQIQDFLNAKVPTCDTNGTQPYGGTTRAEYGTSRGYPPPFICLKNFRQDTVSKSAETGLCNGYGLANQSAAEIIYNVAASCGVNPKVLIVLLEKEQSLVTDDWPWSIQYRSATGYGCPDTAPCDAEYYGFFNQVYAAARQFKRYARDADLFNYRRNTNSYVQYNPNAGCGGTNIYIQNQATAGLYNYTPYQPNAAALNNLYGMGDGCSAYGNRNFWRIYNDWFGSTHASNLAWNVTYRGYTLPGGTEQPYTSGVPLDPDQIVTLKMIVRNTGNVPWNRDGYNATHLFAWNDKAKTIRTGSWLSEDRPAKLTEATVAPGELGTFVFTARASYMGNFGNYFNLITEGVSFHQDIGTQALFNFNVRSGLAWQKISQTYGNPAVTDMDGIPVGFGETVPVTVTVKNTGDITWRNNNNYPVRLATWFPVNHDSIMQGSGWLWSQRPAAMNEASVAPGQNASFTFNVKANRLGNYGEYYNVVMDGLSSFPMNGFIRVNLNVKSDYKWQVVSQSYGTSPEIAYVGGVPMTPGSTKTLKLVVKNVGNATWKNSGNTPVNMATWFPSYRSSPFKGSDWISDVRVVTMQEASVAPGQNATFVFNVKAPNTTGNFPEYFNLVAEGITWFQENGLMRFNFNVWP